MAELPLRPQGLPHRANLHAFFSLGFRPLYLAACAWALVSIILWIFWPGAIPSSFPAVAWHAHEMLWGFIATVAVGFLLTASATWTGFNPLKGMPLALVCSFWLAARAAFLIDSQTAYAVGFAAEMAFFLGSAFALARVVAKGKSRRNYGIPLLVLGLAMANALYLKAASGGDYAVLMRHFEFGMLCMALLALLIARRVIPFFAMRKVTGLQLPMEARSGQAQMVFGVLAIACGVAGQHLGMAVLLALVGLISFWQLARWTRSSILKEPILWILYVGYAALGLGLLLAAWQLSGLAVGTLARPAVHVHVIGMGGFAVLIIGMLTRTALGHLGRPLLLDLSMLSSYYLMIAAVVLRVGALWPTSAGPWLVQAAALCWAGSMALYLWRFTPMLIRPRADVNNSRQA